MIARTSFSAHIPLPHFFCICGPCTQEPCNVEKLNIQTELLIHPVMLLEWNLTLFFFLYKNLIIFLWYLHQEVCFNSLKPKEILKFSRSSLQGHYSGLEFHRPPWATSHCGPLPAACIETFVTGMVNGRLVAPFASWTGGSPPSPEKKNPPMTPS